MSLRSGSLFRHGLAVCAFGVAFSSVAVQAEGLSQYGLGNMRPVGDVEGSRVRGQGFSAGVSGMSFVSGFLIDPSSGSNTFAVSSSHASNSSTGEGTPIPVTQGSSSGVQFGLVVDTNGSIFSGSITGVASGGSSATFPFPTPLFAPTSFRFGR